MGVVAIMKLHDLFESVVAQVLDERSPDLDVLLVMYLLHTHLIQLREGVVLDDVVFEGLLGSLTKKDAAVIVSKKVQRGTEAFWLRQYALRTPFEFHDELPVGLIERAGALRQRASEHSLVSELVPGEG